MSDTESTLSGRVEDAEGRPLVGVEIAYETARESSRTGPDGKFVLRGSAGSDPAIVVVRDGSRMFRVPVEGGSGERVRIVAAPPDVLPLGVLTPGSAPVPTRFGWLALTRGEGGYAAGPSGEAHTPRFFARGLAAGTHAVIVWAGPFLPTVVDGIVLDGITSHELVTVELTRRGASIGGRVVDPAGAPRPSATVTAIAEDAATRVPPGRATSTSDAGGRYRIEGLPPGRYVLTVETADRAKTETTVHLLAREERALDLPT